MKAKKAYLIKKLLTAATELKYFDDKASLQAIMAGAMSMMNSFEKVDLMSNPAGLLPNLQAQAAMLEKFFGQAKLNEETAVEGLGSMISIGAYKEQFLTKLTAIWVKGIDEMCT